MRNGTSAIRSSVHTARATPNLRAQRAINFMLPTLCAPNERHTDV